MTVYATLNYGDSIAMSVAMPPALGPVLASMISVGFSDASVWQNFSMGLVGPQQTTVDFTVCYLGPSGLQIADGFMGFTIASFRKTGLCALPHIQPVKVQPGGFGSSSSSRSGGMSTTAKVVIAGTVLAALAAGGYALHRSGAFAR